MRRTLVCLMLLTLVLALVGFSVRPVPVLADSPAISISPTSGIPETSVTVTGTSFTGNETGIVVTYDGTVMVSGLSASPTGSWSTTLTVPSSAGGNHAINAYGSITPATSVIAQYFTVTPSISVRSGTAGSIIITGIGFGANETGITVTYDGTAIGSALQASARGVWNATLTVPASASGSHIIDAYGASTVATSVPDQTYSVSPSISIKPASGTPRSSITVTGASFGANETNITVTYDGTAIGSVPQANAQGGWTITLAVPASASGSHTIDASGTSTLATSIPDVNFVVSPSIAINRASGAPGSPITVTGNGFAANETNITVTYDGTAIGSVPQANAQGGWTLNLTIPTSTSGSHTINASGTSTSASSVPAVSFTIGAGVSISPTFGNVGTTITITGHGFAPNSPVRFIYDDKEVLAEGGTTDTSGSFSQSMVIPKSRAGTHTIKVTAGQNDAKVVFNMENVAPAVPRPMSPEDGARVGILGSAIPTLKWTSVTDPSGISYILQIDTTPDFTQPILVKTELSGTSYTLTNAEALNQGEYYWRVKAIDGASNESVWAPPQLLKAGLMSLATMLSLIALILLAGITVYFLLRLRAAPKKRKAVPVPEVEAPQVITGQWREVEPRVSETEEATMPAARRPLPWRLALPQPTKQAKILSSEEQARLKTITDFAQSLPLVEPGLNVDWLLELVETSTGLEVSPIVREQLLKGELQVNYEPAWMHHPTYQDLTSLLEGQPILGELNAFVDGANRCATEAGTLLRDIYHDANAEIPSDIMEKNCWGFITAVYSDSISWFLGKSLRPPSERDYSIKPSAGPGEGTAALWLHGEQTTCFAGPLIEASNEEEALQLRALNLKLRRAYRNSDRSRQVVALITQLEVQRTRLLDVFSQFGHINIKSPR